MLGYDERYWGQTLTGADGRSWTCVGFVPYKGTTGNQDTTTLKQYIFTDDGADGFAKGSLDDAKELVATKNGVLYGEQATAANIQALAAQISDKSVTIMTVWYVAPRQQMELRTYDAITIASRTVTFQDCSDGVSFTCGEVTYDKASSTYTAEITITIDSDAPDDLNVNLEEVLTEAMRKIEVADAKNSFLPGDKMVYYITLQNESGKDYQFVDGSAVIGTPTGTTSGAVLGTGFDGRLLNGADSNGKSTTAHRLYTQPLQELGVTEDDDIRDETIGALLRNLGYGAEEDLTDAEVTQKYLAWYYLDYLNTFREENEKLDNFQNLTMQEVSLLISGGYYIAVDETCSEVAEAMYYFLYQYLLQVNGQSIYEQMADQSTMNALFAELVSGETVQIVYAELDGNGANNAYQDFIFGFNIQFAMQHSADATEAPDETIPETPTVPVVTPTTPDAEPSPVTIPDEQTPLAEEPETPEIPTPVESVEEETPVTEIPDEQTPLADQPEAVADIPDEQVPLGAADETPNTGDTRHNLLWMALCLAAGLALFLMNRFRDEEREEN
jgi:hypothetical protein